MSPILQITVSIAAMASVFFPGVSVQLLILAVFAALFLEGICRLFSDDEYEAD
jgi:hypothetical protein